MRTPLKLILSFAIASLTASAFADSTVYVINGAAQFGTVNTSTGSFNPIGPGLPEGSAGLVSGPGGSLLTLGVSGELYSINPSTGVPTAIGSTGLLGSTPGTFANTIGELNGVVYVTDMNNSLYTVNTSTGLATLIGATGIPGDPNCGFYPNLCDEALVSSGGNLYATYDAFLAGSDGYTNPVLVDPDLWQIDPATASATLLSSTELHILSLTNDNGIILGFEGFPSAANPLPNPLVDAVSLDLGDGSTTVLSALDPSTGPIFGVAPGPSSTPEPTSLALLGTSLAAIAVRLRSIKIRKSRT